MSIVSIALAVLGLSVLVIVHETGHYLAARAFGMRVLRYSIGIGPTIWRYKPNGSDTVFQVGALPLMAYVHIAGMNPQDEADAKDPALFPNQGLWARAVTIAAGPLANYLMGSLLAFGVALYGWPEDVPTRPMQVQQISAGSPAAKAQLQVGDVILRANHREVGDVEDLIAITTPRAGLPTTYVISRQGATREITMVPVQQGKRGIIGVTAKFERHYVPMGLAKAARAALEFPAQMTVAQLMGISELVRKRSTEGLTGPVGMGKMVAEQAGKGWPEYLSMLMLLSVALGMFNLLPLPALDGGRLVFLGYEMVTRQRPNERLEAIVHTVGLLFLLGTLVLITFRDVMG